MSSVSQFTLNFLTSRSLHFNSTSIQEIFGYSRYNSFSFTIACSNEYFAHFWIHQPIKLSPTKKLKSGPLSFQFSTAKCWAIALRDVEPEKSRFFHPTRTKARSDLEITSARRINCSVRTRPMNTTDNEICIRGGSHSYISACSFITPRI